MEIALITGVNRDIEFGYETETTFGIGPQSNYQGKRY